MKIIFCGGGTAGHITPALAIAKELKRVNNKNEILFIGRDGGVENDLIAKAGFAYTTIPASGIQRKITLKNIKALSNAFRGKNEAKKIIRAFSPDAIIGTGGYVCWPVITAGVKMNIPVFIHESNVYPGLTTRLLAKKCNTVFLYNEESVKFLPSKTNFSVVGNPISRDFFTISKKDARKELGLKPKDVFILSFGGSLGAQRINESAISVMKTYSSKKEDVLHIHATGRANYKSEYKTLFTEESGCKIIPFLDNMPIYMKAADIVICRSGAMTVAELAASGTSAILIPSPNVADNHQMKNAHALSDKNAAIIIEESNLSDISLKEKIKHLTNHPEERKRLSKCIELFAKKDVETRILSEVISSIKHRQKITK